MDRQGLASQGSGKKYFFVVGLLLLLAVGGGIYAVASNSSVKNQSTPLPQPTISATIQENTTPLPSSQVVATSSGKTVTMDNGLQIQDEVVGTGAEAVPGKKVTVNYVGTLVDGTKFDSSYDHGTPFSFNLGAGEVIVGWDQGVAGMKIGGKRKLIVPPSLGYGSQTVGPIPANSTLVFEVELLGVE